MFLFVLFDVLVLGIKVNQLIFYSLGRCLFNRSWQLDICVSLVLAKKSAAIAYSFHFGFSIKIPYYTNSTSPSNLSLILNCFHIAKISCKGHHQTSSCTLL